MVNHLRELVSLTIPERLAGRMVKDIIRNELGISRGLLRKIVASKGVQVNKQPVFITSRVRTGDQLTLYFQPEESEAILPEPLPLSIVFEDEDILVVDKQAGMVVHPTKGHYTGTLANGVVYHWQTKGEHAKFRPVHRLDKDTSGLLVIGKNHFTNQKLSEQIQGRLFRREYLAVVHGIVPDDLHTIEAPILKREDHPVERIVHEAGQPAITHLKIEERFRDATLIRLELKTGRTHQIRVHMKHVGHPLYGDSLYGIGKPDGITRQALHAAVLGFTHPRTKAWMEWTSPIPADISQLLEDLRKLP